MGVSSPMEPTASWPLSASGRSTWSRSSKLTWNIFWATARASASMLWKLASSVSADSRYCASCFSQRL